VLTAPANYCSPMATDELTPLTIKRLKEAESGLPAECAGHSRTLPSTCCLTCWPNHRKCCPSGLDVVSS
jgi:hypothetical protein